MLLLAALVATATWSCKSFLIFLSFLTGTHGCAKHLPKSLNFRTVRLECHFKDVSEYDDSTIIHWYQQKENAAPVRMLYLAQSKVVDDGFQASKYMAEKVPRQKTCILTINDVIPDDTATYYCAYWDSHCVFGTGTKLIVSGKFFNKVTSSPASSEILQKRHGNQIMYVCLIEKFYPEVIRVTWTDEANKEVTDNIVKGDVWKPANGDKYSIGSWLTVPAKNKDKNYYCKYEHESQHIQKFLKTVLPLC
uniref:Ig-like domain-containing protein n=1 Tax=Athene cunicularia TaxID=194338 RepID=A0A663MAS4_ATHCN